MDQTLIDFFDQNEHLKWAPEPPPDIREKFKRFFESGEPHRAYECFLPSEISDFFTWIRNNSTCTSVRMNLDMPFDQMYQEGLDLYPWAVSHRSGSHSGWKSIALHGIEYDKTNDANQYGYPNILEAPYRWTVASAAAPITTSWFKHMFPVESCLRIRFMYLEPGGFILPHHDSPNPGMGAINLALNNPSGCDMAIEGKGVIPWVPGDVRYLDVHNTHAVWNRSDSLRIHMIAHARDWGVRTTDFQWAVIIGYLRSL
jgi:hypothetical protein